MWEAPSSLNIENPALELSRAIESNKGQFYSVVIPKSSPFSSHRDSNSQINQPNQFLLTNPDIVILSWFAFR